MKRDRGDCGLCGRPIAHGERYRRFQASVDGFDVQRVGHLECIRAMGDASPSQMWEEGYQALVVGSAR